MNDVDIQRLAFELRELCGSLDASKLAGYYRLLVRDEPAGPQWEAFRTAYGAALEQSYALEKVKIAKANRDAGLTGTMTTAFITPEMQLQMLDVHWDFLAE